MLVSTMGATSGAPGFTPVFSGIRVTRSFSLFICVVDICLSFCACLCPLCCLILFDVRILILILILDSDSDSDSDSWFWFLILILILNTFFCIFKLFLFQQCSCSLTQYTYIVVKYEIILHSLRNMLRDFHQRLAFIPVSKPSTKWFFLFSDNVRILYE